MAKESKTNKKSQDVIFGANEEIRRAVDKIYVKKTSAIMTAAIFADRSRCSLRSWPQHGPYTG